MESGDVRNASSEPPTKKSKLSPLNVSGAPPTEVGASGAGKPREPLSRNLAPSPPIFPVDFYFELFDMLPDLNTPPPAIDSTINGVSGGSAPTAAASGPKSNASASSASSSNVSNKDGGGGGGVGGGSAVVAAAAVAVNAVADSGEDFLSANGQIVESSDGDGSESSSKRDVAAAAAERSGASPPVEQQQQQQQTHQKFSFLGVGGGKASPLTGSVNSASPVAAAGRGGLGKGKKEMSSSSSLSSSGDVGVVVAGGGSSGGAGSGEDERKPDISLLGKQFGPMSTGGGKDVKMGHDFGGSDGTGGLPAAMGGKGASYESNDTVGFTLSLLCILEEGFGVLGRGLVESHGTQAGAARLYSKSRLLSVRRRRRPIHATARLINRRSKIKNIQKN